MPGTANFDLGAGANPDLALLQDEQQQAMGTRDAAADKLAADSSSFDPDAATGPAPQFTQPTPQDHFNDVMKQAPLMMALGALGGAFSKQHGITMLASTNAMMKGIVQGSADAYKEARDKYDEQYQQYRDKQKTWMDVYKAYSAAYKGRIDADVKAVQGANAAVGVIDRETRLTKSQIAQTALLNAKIDQAHATVTHMGKEDVVAMIRAENDKVRADADAKRAGASQENADTRKATALTKNSAAGAGSGEALKTIDELEQLIDKNPGVTGFGGKIRRGAEFVGSSVDGDMKLPATEFQSKMDLLLSKVPEILKQKGGKMGVDQRKKIDDAVSALQGATSGPQAKVKLEALKELLGAPETKVIDGKTYRSLGNGRWTLQQ